MGPSGLRLTTRRKLARTDTVETDVVKAVVSSHAARHVGGIVKPLKKTLIIKIECLASGMGGNLRWEDHAELSPSLTVLVWISISSTSTPGRASRNGAVK